MLAWFFRRYRVRLVLRAFGRFAERVRYAAVRPDPGLEFHIVSSQRNAGEAALRCVESVHRQRWPRARVRHVMLDDASADGTADLVQAWMDRNPGHPVELVRRATPVGGTVNNLDGFKMARPGSVVLELNGDDWLPDPGVLPFLARVYRDPEVWATFNTMRQTDGVIPIQLPPPRRAVREGSVRRRPWASGHLHTFREELLAHVPRHALIDPTTGQLWAQADDKALYFAMLELAREHARHVWRVVYVYNPGPGVTTEATDPERFAARIRQLPPVASLGGLSDPPRGPVV